MYKLQPLPLSLYSQTYYLNKSNWYYIMKHLRPVPVLRTDFHSQKLPI